MNNEHTVVKGASRLDSCAKHVEKVLSDDGYRVTVSKIAGGNVTQVHVVKPGANKKVIAYAVLNLWTMGDDLKFQMEKNAAVSNPCDSFRPLEFILGFPVSLLLDVQAQLKLEEKLFIAATLFLTAS